MVLGPTTLKTGTEFVDQDINSSPLDLQIDGTTKYWTFGTDIYLVYIYVFITDLDGTGVNNLTLNVELDNTTRDGADKSIAFTESRVVPTADKAAVFTVGPILLQRYSPITGSIFVTLYSDNSNDAAGVDTKVWIHDAFEANLAAVRGQYVDTPEANGLIKTNCQEFLETAVTLTNNQLDVNAAQSGGATPPTVTDIMTAFKALVGFTEGGSWTKEKLDKCMFAYNFGKWQLKSGETNVYEVLDAENASTVIMEVTVTTTSPYRTVSVLI